MPTLPPPPPQQLYLRVSCACVYVRSPLIDGMRDRNGSPDPNGCSAIYIQGRRADETHLLPSFNYLTDIPRARPFVRSLARLVTQSYLITDFKKYIGGMVREGNGGGGKRHLVGFTYARAII